VPDAPLAQVRASMILPPAAKAHSTKGWLLLRAGSDPIARLRAVGGRRGAYRVAPEPRP
jgi:hypothetical protein